MRTIAPILISGALGYLPSAAAASEWTLDSAHSTAQFTIRHMMVSNVRGTLAGVTGRVHLDDADIAKSTVAAKLDVATINTREENRDAHLKSPDFFDVAKFPAITFTSTGIQRGTSLVVTGNLSIHGVVRPVVLQVELTGEVKDPWGNVRRGIQATTKIHRKDFGLTWNKALDAGGVLVGDEVQITIDAELVRSK